MEEFIVSDPKVMFGRPTIKGTRITVELIRRKLAAGESIERILNDYRFLTESQVRAAMAFGDTSKREPERRSA